MSDPDELCTASAPIDAVATVPGSKSLANRALVCAALADGDSVVQSLAPGDDTAGMIDGIVALGASVRRPTPSDQRSGASADESVDQPMDGLADDAVWVTGTGGRLTPGPARVDARLAGTTSRFLTAMCALGDGPYVVDGDEPLRTRPMEPLHAALRSLGVSVRRSGDGGLPVEVRGPARGGEVSVRGDISSQYLTALMLIGPFLPGGLVARIEGTLVSAPYVELTRSVMHSFGADDVVIEPGRVVVAPGRYAPIRYRVEPDASSASYPMAIAAVVGGRCRVPGLGHGALQGDARFADLLAAMGCHVERSDEAVEVRRDPGRALVGIDVDMSEISDLVPTVAVVAATASTPTRIRGVGFVRGKESDRLGDLARELRRSGADVREVDDGLEIHPVGGLHGAQLATHHDHRLAMAFGVLAAVVDGLSLDDASVVSKSWPGFWDARRGWIGRA